MPHHKEPLVHSATAGVQIMIIITYIIIPCVCYNTQYISSWLQCNFHTIEITDLVQNYTDTQYDM